MVKFFKSKFLSFKRNPDDLVTPRIVAGFIPVMPQAAEDLYLLYRDKEHLMETKFGEILPRWSPKLPGWRSSRIPGIDFSSLIFGLAAHHPKLGMKFFKDKTKFTFNQ
jgi:hypothetical protein